MSAELIVTAHYDHCPDALFQRASSFGDMIEATRKISTYSGLPPVQMEEGKTYTTDVKVFGLLKSNGYRIMVNRLCPNIKLMESYEYGDAINLWWHRLQIKPTETGSIWIDHVVIDAGLKTPIISRYAKYMYQHRHKSRRGMDIEAVLRRSYRHVEATRPNFYPAE